MNFIIEKKGYKIDLDRVQDTYLWSERQCQADSVNEAKKLLLDTVRYDDMRLNNGDDVTYLNIPVVRAKGVDIIIYNGEKKERWRVEFDIAEEQRISELRELCLSHKYFYIYKGSYYRPNSNGYTSLKEFAGVYDSKDAFISARHCREVRLIPINIEEHNNMIEKTISNLSSRLILTAT